MNEKNKFLSYNRRIKLGLISLAVGILIFIIAYLGMKQNIGLGKLNQPLLTWIVNHRNEDVTDIAKIITSIANPLEFASIIIVLVAIWVAIKKEVWRPLLFTGSIIVAAVTSTLLKTVFMDARPPHIDMIPTFEYDFSFPSGHTIGVAVFLLVIGYLIYSRQFSKKLFWVWISVAVFGTSIIAFSRLYLGYHWLTDIVASVGLALIVLSIVIFVDTFFIRKYKSKQYSSNTDR